GRRPARPGHPRVRLARRVGRPARAGARAVPWRHLLNRRAPANHCRTDRTKGYGSGTFGQPSAVARLAITFSREYLQGERRRRDPPRRPRPPTVRAYRRHARLARVPVRGRREAPRAARELAGPGHHLPRPDP